MAQHLRCTLSIHQPNRRLCRAVALAQSIGSSTLQPSIRHPIQRRALTYLQLPIPATLRNVLLVDDVLALQLSLNLHLARGIRCRESRPGIPQLLQRARHEQALLIRRALHLLSHMLHQLINLSHCGALRLIRRHRSNHLLMGRIILRTPHRMHKVIQVHLQLLQVLLRGIVCQKGILKRGILRA